MRIIAGIIILSLLFYLLLQWDFFRGLLIFSIGIFLGLLALFALFVLLPVAILLIIHWMAK
jgi:hypothetical protein